MSNIDSQTLATLANLVQNSAPDLSKILLSPNASIATAALGQALLNNPEASATDLINKARNDNITTQLAISAAEVACKNNTPSGDSTATQMTVNEYGNTMNTAYNDIEIAKALEIKAHQNTNKCLAYLITLFLFTLIFALIFIGDQINSESVQSVLTVLLGVVGTGWANIIGYYFGSSAGSQQKTQALTESLAQKQ